MKKEELLCYIWLSLRCGAGSEEASHLLDAFEGAGNVYAAKRDELAAVCDNDATVDSLCDKNMSMPKKILDFCIKNDVGILTCDSEYYPSRLRSIYAKPIVLYCKGKMRDLDKNVLIACVGTRNCTEYGRTMAYKMGAELAMGGALHGMMKEQGGLQMATVPGTPEYIDEISYWIPDITDLREQMVDMQGAQMTERYRQGAEKMEAEYKRNLITAQEKEKQKAAEEKIKADEQTEKKIKEDTKEKNKEKADAEKKAKAKKSKSGEELGPAEKDGQQLTEPPKAVKPPAKESSRNTVSVKVVDCSGKGAGSDAAARLAAMGFEVIDGGSDPERDQTTVVSTTSNGRVVSRLSAVPFPYTLRILRADDASYDAVIFIGKDYQ